MTTITLSQLTGSLGRAWNDAIGSEVPTIYPHMFANTEHWGAWYELSIDSWLPRWPRAGDPLHGELRFRVTVSTQPSLNLAEGQELVEQARAVFSGVSVPIRTSSSDPILGYLRFSDATIENQSLKATHPGGQLWVLQWIGEVLAEL